MKIIKLVIIILIIINSGSIFADTNEKEPLYSQLNRAIVRLEHIENTIKEGSKKVITKTSQMGQASSFFTKSHYLLFRQGM